jgi:hypothetical protein
MVVATAPVAAMVRSPLVVAASWRSKGAGRTISAALVAEAVKSTIAVGDTSAASRTHVWAAIATTLNVIATAFTRRPAPTIFAISPRFVRLS